MTLSKKLLNRSKVYLILDTSVNDYDKLFSIVKESAGCGVDIFQLRDKAGSVKDILSFSERVKKLLNERALYIINDRVDLAIEAEADGVHLGQEDVSCGVARRLLGSNAIIGKSCQNLEHALDAEQQGADYIGFGSVFKTKTKPERNPMDLQILEKVLQKVKIPVFPIGGISMNNIAQLREINVSRVAVCRAISEARNIVGAVELIRAALT